MLYYYLVECNNKNPIRIIGNKKYIHIKSYIDGTKILICSNIQLIGAFITSKTKEQTQQILDNWINYENQNLEKDKEGNDILQKQININIYKE